MMSLFSRISVFFSGCSRVLETMALATIWIGTDMELEPIADMAQKNFLASHSAGRLSCLSTNKTLGHKGRPDFRGYCAGFGIFFSSILITVLVLVIPRAVTGTWSTSK